MVLKLSDPVGSITRSAVWGFEDEYVTSIADKMIMHDIGAIIVTRQSMPVGMITEKDIVEKVVKAGKDPRRMRAREIMSSPVTTIEAEKSIADALKLMRDKDIRRLAVLDREKPTFLGIVTIRRILDALVET
jgi:CBS domain-containing protein